MPKQLTAIVGLCQFVARNVLASRVLPPIASAEHRGIIYRAIARRDLPEVERLHCQLTNRPRLPLEQRIICRLLGHKLGIVAVFKDPGQHCNPLVGFNIYYFNKRDVLHATIHSANIGVVQEVRGRGVAYGMMRRMFTHVAAAGLAGVSARIAEDNHPSLAIARLVGLRAVEEDVDPGTGKRRYYLIRKLEAHAADAIG